MRKKNPTPDNIYAVFGCREKQAGRSPKGPKDAQGLLEELIKHSESWMRRCDEVWFFTGSPLIEDAAGATKLPDLPELYDEAIAVVQWVAGYAQEAEERLKKGRRAAKRKQREAGGTGKAAAEGPPKKR